MSAIKRLSIIEIKKRLRRLPGWTYNGKTHSIHTELKCENFMAVVKLIDRIAKLVEKTNHHPDLHLTHYRRLKIVLTTHEAGGVTGRDFKLARVLPAVISTVLARFSAPLRGGLYRRHSRRT